MTTFSSLEAKFRTGTTDPTSPNVGDLYYDTTNNRLMRYDGAKWTGAQFNTSTSTSTSTTTSTSTSTTTSTSITSTSTTTSTSTSTSTTTSTTTTL